MKKVSIECSEYSTLYHGRRHLAIDRVRVEAIITIFGESLFFVIGHDQKSDEWFQLSPQEKQLEAAWAAKEALDKQLRAARTERNG